MSATSRMLTFARIALVLPLLASGMVFATQFASTPQAEAASAYTKKVRAMKIADAYSNAGLATYRGFRSRWCGNARFAIQCSL